MSSPWMATKYAILQQNADTASAAQQSQSGLQQAQGGLIGQQAQGAGIQNQFLPDVLKGEIRVNQNRADNLAEDTTTKRLDNAPADGTLWQTYRQRADALGLQNALMGVPSRKPLGMKTGMTRVPGKGDGTKDTVPAKLAPGEAVMNKAAADHMGRGLIAVLNKLGAEKMGMVAPRQSNSGPQNFAMGTEEVKPRERLTRPRQDEDKANTKNRSHMAVALQEIQQNYDARMEHLSPETHRDKSGDTQFRFGHLYPLMDPPPGRRKLREGMP